MPDVVQRDHKNEMAGGGILAASGDVFSRRISALEIKDPVFHTGGAGHATGQGTMDGSAGGAARTAQAPDKAVPVKNAVSRRDSARAADEGKWDSQWLRCRVSPRVSRELSPGFGSATAPKIFGHLTRARSYIRICTGNSRMPRMKLEKRRLGRPITWMSRSRASISSQRIFNCRSASRSPTQRWMPAP